MLYDCLGYILMFAMVFKIAAFRKEEEILLVDYRRNRYEN